MLESRIARHRSKIVIGQLYADGPADVPFALKIAAQVFAQHLQNLRKGLPIAQGMQVALKGDLAADGLRLAFGYHRSLIAPVRGLDKPARVALTKMLHELVGSGLRQFAERAAPP